MSGSGAWTGRRGGGGGGDSSQAFWPQPGLLTFCPCPPIQVIVDNPFNTPKQFWGRWRDLVLEPQVRDGWLHLPTAALFPSPLGSAGLTSAAHLSRL